MTPAERHLVETATADDVGSAAALEEAELARSVEIEGALTRVRELLDPYLGDDVTVNEALGLAPLSIREEVTALMRSAG